MAIQAQMADGRILEFPDGTDPTVIQNTVKRLIAESQPAPSTERTWGEAAKDVAASALGGLGSLAQFPGQLVKLVPGMAGVGEALETPGEYISKTGEALKSEGLKAREALRSKALSDAEKDGVLSQFATAITSTIKDPALITSFVAEQVPLLIGPAGAARLAQKVGAKGIEAAGAGLAGKEAVDAMQAAAGKLGTRAAIGTGAAMQAADVSSDAYQAAYDKAIQQGMTPQQAQDAALNVARIAAGGAGAVSLGTAGLLSKMGGTAIERRLAGLPGQGRVTGALGEATSESLEEAGGQLAQNIAMRQVDPTQSLTAGVGAAAGLGALGGGVFGGLLAAKPKAELAPGQREGETLYDTANRLNAQIKALDEMARQTETDQQRQGLGLKTNGELVDMYRTQGYGAVKQYQQQLAQMIRTPETTPEQREEAKAMVLSIEDLLTQVTKEEQQRRAPASTTNVMTENDVATKFGIPRNDPIYKDLVGKDLAKPQDAEVVVNLLQDALNRKGLRAGQRNKFDAALQAVNAYLETVPGSGFYAAPPVEPTSGERAGVAGVTDTGAAAPRVGGSEPSGVVRPTEVVGQPAGGEGVKPAPVEGSRETTATPAVPAPIAPAVAAPAPAPAAETVAAPAPAPALEAPKYKIVATEVATDTGTPKRAWNVMAGDAIVDTFNTRKEAQTWVNQSKAAKPSLRSEALETAELKADPANYAATPQRGWRQKGDYYSHESGFYIYKNPETLWYEAVLPSGGRIKDLSRNANDAKRIALREVAAQVDRYETVAKPSLRPEAPPAGVPANIWQMHSQLNTLEQQLSGELPMPTRTDGRPQTAGTLGGIQKRLFRRYNAAVKSLVGDAQALPFMRRLNTISSIQRAVQENDDRALETYKVSSPQEYAEVVEKKRSVRPETEARAAELLKQRAAAPAAPAAAPETAPQPAKTQAEQYAAARAELVKQLDGILKKILAKYGLKDVTLNLQDAMEDQGSYARQVIELALNVDNPVRTLRHESIHALKDMGFFSDAQWKVLEKRAKDEWIGVLQKTKHDDTQSRYDAYVALFTQEGSAKGLTGDALTKYVEEAVIEEAIADAFGDFDAKKAPPGLMNAILNRMRNLFKAIKEAFGKAGIESAEDIFGKIEEGKLKPTKEIAPKVEAEEEEQGDKSSIRVATKNEKVSQWIKKVNDQFPVSPLDSNQRAIVFDEENFALFELSQSFTRNDAAEIKWIQAYPLRGGNGSKAIRILQNLAEKDGIALTLFPWDKGRVSKASLIRFYKRMGFKPVAKGGDSMVWEPPEEMAIKLKSGPEAFSKSEKTEEAQAKPSLRKGKWYVDATSQQQATLDRWEDEHTAMPSNWQDLDIRSAREDIYDAASAHFYDYEKAPGLFEIPITDIGPLSGYNTPKDKQRIQNLAEQIKENGEIEPVFVAVDPDGEAYLMEGQHRSRALELLGYKSVPARVVVSMDHEEQAAKPSLRPQKSNAWQASDSERQEALDMYNEEGFLPYVSQGFLNVPLDGKKYSLQKYNPEKHLAFDPVLNVPINKDGTITAYYHTTKAGALNINNNKMIAAEGRNRIYLTNESGGADVLRNRGSFDQDLDGSTVLVYVTPDMLQVDQMYDNGRVDFFIPLAQGEYFNKKMKMQSIQKARTEAIAQEFSYDDHEEKITNAIEKYKAATAEERRAMVKRAKDLLKREHNVSSLLTENGKLEKTRIGEYDLSYDGLPVASQGLGLASAQKITDKTSTCPRSSICEGLCLGETSGGNFMFGGAAAEDVGDIQKSAFRAGARMMQYLKTEALIVHPQEFAVLLQSEIDALKRWSEKPTQRKKNPETGKVETTAKEIYAPAVRLNVTSDFKPEMFRGVIEGNPDVMFYDYTKINSNSIADNHHLTYSSTGFGQIVDGERVFFKNKAGNYDHNWGTVRQRLNDGFNVAMAFSSKSGLPKTLTDEETGIVYKVLDGDLYDARFLDEYSPEKRDSEGRGVIVGLRNKAGTLSEKNATQKTGGFFVNYDPKRDGSNVTVPDQAQFKPRRIPIAVKPSLRTAPDTPQFKFWFGKSTIVDKDGNPKVMYHGTGKDYEVLGTGRRQAKAIFLTDDPEFAEKFAKDTFTRAASEAAKGVGISEEAFKQGIKRAVEAIRKDYGSSAEGKAMIADVRKGYDNASPEAQEYMTKAFRDAVPAGPNIIPVYVKAEYPFDYENPEHVAILAKMLTPDSIPSEENRKKLEQTLAQSIAKGDWEKIERPEAQAIIRQLGFDGFYVQEGGRKSLAVYNPNQVKSVFNQAPTEAPELRKSLRSGAERFNQDEIQKQAKPGYKSRYKLIEMPIDDFLSLADAGIVRTKTEDARAILERGDNFETIPFLKAEDNGQVYGHEGRHRARALKELGYTSMPVELRMANLRWSEQLDPNNFDYEKDWPETLKAQDKAEDPSFSIPFPVKREDSMRPYDVKPSLRSIASAMTPQVRTTVDKIAPPTYDPNIKERILNAIHGDTFTSIRKNIVNRYERLAEYDRRVAKEIERMGGIQQLADSKAEAAALFSDLGAGLLETAMGAHDRIGGIPVYQNGVTTISNFGGTIKGPIAIFKPLSDLKDPDAFRLYQSWAAVKRGKRLNVEGREELIDAADIAAMRAMERANPNLAALFNAIQQDWIAYNNGLVKYMQATGVITPQMAAEWIKHSDYFPFYRLIDEDVAGPKMFTSIGNVRPPKKLKGGEAPLGDFFENIVRNSQAAIQAGIKNVAAQRATEQALRLNEVTRLPRKATGANVYRVLENGREVFYQSHDPLFIEAIKGLNMPDLPFIGLLAGPANILRNLVTKDPAFMLANMMRDSLSAWATSGVNMTPMIDTFKNFGKAIAGQSPELQQLYAAGVLGGYDYARGAKVSGAEFQKRLREVSGTKTKFEKITSPATSLWGALEKGTQASDAATRIEVYKRVLAETGNEAEAYWQALEVMNFNRKGSSPVVRVLTAAIPFLNARMQGLDLLFRTAIYPSKPIQALLGQDQATQEAKQRMKTFWVRGMTMMALSSMYWLLTHDDDDYKKQEQETRDNFWLIPSLGVKIPIPFEVGVMFKVIPERIMENWLGQDTNKDFADSMKRQFLSTFGMNFIPQIALPVYEVRTNYSFFTDRPIIGKGLEGVAPQYQIGPGTSRVAELLGQSVGYSPMKIDHLVKGYLGTIGQYASDLIDMIYDMNSDAPKASKRFEQMPIIRRFAVDPEARGTVTSYYKLKDAVDEVVRSSNLLERSMNYKEWGPYYTENVKMLATKDYLNDLEKSMKDYREMRQFITSSTMDADAKRDTLKAIGRMELALTANIQTLKKQVQ